MSIANIASVLIRADSKTYSIYINLFDEQLSFEKSREYCLFFKLIETSKTSFTRYNILLFSKTFQRVGKTMIKRNYFHVEFDTDTITNIVPFISSVGAPTHLGELVWEIFKPTRIVNIWVMRCPLGLWLWFRFRLS